MDLYLHIGTEKTGTTSVQKFFRANRDVLARNGIFYPAAPGNQNHMGLAVAAQRSSKRAPLRKSVGVRSEDDVEKFRADLARDLAAELSGGAYETVVMSGEHCSSRLLEDDEVRWLKEFLSPFFDRIHIVVYIRRQDDYLLSTYSTAVKSGATGPLHLPPEKTIRHRYDHWNLLSRWARVFGRENIVCRKFEKSALRSGDIVDDFLDAAAIDGNRGYRRPANVNESLDAETLEFLRLFNGHIPRFAKGGINPERNNIVSLLSKVSQGPLVTLPDDELARFMALFEDTNRQVAMEYFGGVRSAPGDPLFEPRADPRERTRAVKLTAERAVEFCAWLWREKQAQVERLSGGRKKRQAGQAPLRKRRRRQGAAMAENAEPQ